MWTLEYFPRCSIIIDLILALTLYSCLFSVTVEPKVQKSVYLEREGWGFVGYVDLCVDVDQNLTSMACLAITASLSILASAHRC